MIDSAFSNFYGFEFTYSGGPLVNVTSSVTSTTPVSYSATDVFSLYSDGTNVIFFINGVRISTTPTDTPLTTGVTYRFFSFSGGTLVAPTLTNVRYYPTGKLGPTGPTGPGFDAITNPADYRILTATGSSTTSALANSNLTWNGSILEVQGDVSANTYNGPGGTAGAPHYTFSDDRTTGMFFPTSGNVAFTTSGSEKMRVLANGNVGIGTTSPNNTLDVAGTITNRGGTTLSEGYVSLLRDGGASRTGFMEFRNSAGTRCGYIGYANASNGLLDLNAENGNGLEIDTGGLPRMTITSNGLTGIGITSPQAVLDVCGNTAFNPPALNVRGFTQIESLFITLLGAANNTYNTVIETDSNRSYINSYVRNTVTLDPIWFRITNNATTLTPMVIDSNGRVGIGTTTPDRALLHVNGSVTFTENLYGWFNSTTIVGPVNATRSNSIYGNQQIWAGGGFAVNSDMRIKKDISDIDDEIALSDLRKLKPKTYKYIDEYYRGKHRVYGFIAQDVRETLPYAVSYEKEEIPNIYDTAQCVPLTDISGTCVTLTTKNATFDLSQTDICGSFITHPTVVLLDKQNTKIYSKLVDIVSSNTFTIDTTLSNDDYFVFGQEVTDFHIMKKDAIFTVATAATQEIDRQLQAAKGRIQQLEDTLSNVMSRLSALENM
jgi:hypothetical protein